MNAFEQRQDRAFRSRHSMDPQVARVLEILQAAPGTAGANTREMITCCIELRNKRKLIEQARAKDNPRAQELADKWEREFEAKTKCTAGSWARALARRRSKSSCGALACVGMLTGYRWRSNVRRR